MFERVNLNDMLFHCNRFCHHALQDGEVGAGDVIVHQFAPHCGGVRVDEPVFQHLCISGAHLCVWESGEEACVEDYDVRGVEHADFVLQPSEVDARLASYRSIDE